MESPQEAVERAGQVLQFVVRPRLRQAIGGIAPDRSRDLGHLGERRQDPATEAVARGEGERPEAQRQAGRLHRQAPDLGVDSPEGHGGTDHDASVFPRRRAGRVVFLPLGPSGGGLDRPDLDPPGYAPGAHGGPGLGEDAIGVRPRRAVQASPLGVFHAPDETPLGAGRGQGDGAAGGLPLDARLVDLGRGGQAVDRGGQPLIGPSIQVGPGQRDQRAREPREHDAQGRQERRQESRAQHHPRPPPEGGSPRRYPRPRRVWISLRPFASILRRSSMTWNSRVFEMPSYRSSHTFS